MAFQYSDYKKVLFTSEEQHYAIGTRIKKPFISEEMVLLATEDVWVAFKDDERDTPTLIHKDVYFEWYRRTGDIWITSAGTDGEVEIWSEGHTRR